MVTVTDSFLLSKLPPFKNDVKVLAKNQTTADIINGILQAHEVYQDDYRRIAPYFIGNTSKETIENIFAFLKNHVRYVIEPGIKQTIKSPAAIIATGNSGSDCKNYALFTAGILRAANKYGGQNIPYAFRFAGYKFGNSDLEHVFVVAFPGTKREIWIDAVLTRLDDRTKYPYIYKDYKFKDMALMGISGVNQAPAVQMGFIDPATLSAVAAGLQQVSQLFGKRPNPNDWKRWKAGDAIHWTLNDGDSVQNEAHNIQQFLLNNLQNQAVLQEYWSRVKVQDLQNKLQRAGARPEDLQAFIQNRPKIQQPQQSIFQTSQPGTTQASSNMFLTIALVGAGILLITQMGKKRR